ncbi:NAD(P)H-quinone oxidoreductase [Thermoflavimicrobium dichotomicum]|uniref:Putative NAD(P)H quinone oxidoreductase, PIG3 family n=1 Tax=Thermoflavimicrobium dichotomicum TaxID=46223 RepID=A0A1I3LN03_9BACL|nr:NAD(P)H-quinone oxidoreductase [Thermoflavimicrobium dichotomicum]SFI86073.1 putative NAD(P)H quinone oxidoreductase, PIG3 family [Thermoflavimicrobium dichotomicum]
MKAILAKQPGGVEQLEFVELPKPKPAADEILVKVYSTALNRADLVQRKGYYPPPPGASPVLGLEFAGVVEEVGENCQDRWKPGDRVFGLLPGGGYAEYVVTPGDLAIPIPSSFTFEQAAAIAEVFITAYQTLFWIGRVQPGETVLIHAGASGVGSAAIQLAKSIGAYSIVTVGSEKKKEFCLNLGANHAINYKQGPFLPEVMKYTDGKGVHLILDFVGAPYWEQNLESLQTDGRLVLIGTLGGTKLKETSIQKILMKRLQITGTTLRSRSVDYKAHLTKDFAAYALPLFESGELKPVIDRIYSWHDVKEAHLYMETNQNMGKIILNIIEDPATTPQV